MDKMLTNPNVIVYACWIFAVVVVISLVSIAYLLNLVLGELEKSNLAESKVRKGEDDNLG